MHEIKNIRTLWNNTRKIIFFNFAKHLAIRKAQANREGIKLSGIHQFLFNGNDWLD